MGGEGAWDHINSCLHHASNWTCAHDHVLRALDRICNDAGFATTHNQVLTSEGNRRADLEIRNIRVAGQHDLLVDVTIRHNFKGTGHNGQTQGQLRNPDNPDHILERAAADKIRNYRDTYRRNRHVAFLPACMSTSGRIHSVLLRLILFISNIPTNRQKMILRPLVFSRTARSFVTVAASSSSKTGAPSGWPVLRL
jgi:hypothetical protein